MIGLVVTGSRHYIDRDRVFRELDRWAGARVAEPRAQGLTVYVGDARGADQFAMLWAISRGFEHKDFRAEWKKYGRHAAGPIRNKAMLTAFMAADLDQRYVLAFKDNFDASMSHGGTEDCVRRAIGLGIPTWLWVNGKGWQQIIG